MRRNGSVGIRRAISIKDDNLVTILMMVARVICRREGPLGSVVA